MKRVLHAPALFGCLIFLFPCITVANDPSIPTPDHIVICILENHAYGQIKGNNAAPHINALMNESFSALFTKSYAIEHPSQPNYIDLYSGCNQGVTNDNVPSGIPFTTPNLGRQLLDAGKTFCTYSESLPSVGYNGAAYGDYARKHNPAANWMGTGTNQVPDTTNKPFTAFPSDYTTLPTVSFVIPNQANDMHNGLDPFRITTADNWVYNKLNGYIQWAKTHNSLFILTFDEDNDKQNNRIVTIFTGEMVNAGQYSDSINHYYVLRTIEDMYGLPYACNAATATTISNCWLTVTGVHTKSNGDLFSVYPNPSNGTFMIQTAHNTAFGLVEIYNVVGEKVFEENKKGSSLTQVQLNGISPGVYFLKAQIGNEWYSQKLLIR